MKNALLILAALAFSPIVAYAHDDVHHGMMPDMAHGKTGRGHSEDDGHTQGVGKPEDPEKVSRVIQVIMSDDMKFTPAQIGVKRGETIRFVVKNAGKMTHEMVIGSTAELTEHAEMMRKMPGMKHADPNQVTLDPGQTGNLVWRFTKRGVFDFACLEVGHLEAGMKGEVSVK